MLSDYIHSMTNDRHAAEGLADVLVQMGVPMKTFSTAVKIYRRVVALSGQGMLREPCHYVSGGALFYRAAEGAPADPARDALVGNQYLLLLTCSMIAYKYNKDIPYANEMWAHQASLDCRQINRMERAVLRVLDYRLVFDGESQILDEMRPYLAPEGPAPEIEKKKRRYRRIFCF